MVTQKQIARQLGVSQSAVACALHPTLHSHISSHKRQRILDTAERLGYVPHHAARRLTRRRFQQPSSAFDQAGLIYFGGKSQYLDPVCLAMIFGAEHELSRLQASFVFVNVGTPGGWEKVDRMAHASGVDGWLVYGPMDDEIVSRLKRGRLPFVIVGDHRCTQPVNCVHMDNAAVGRLAAQHLASRGHRRVAFLAGNPAYVYQPEMENGFRVARKEFGLDEDEGLILDLRRWVGESRLMEWLQNAEPRPTAFFASEFDLAADVCRILKNAGMVVPDDISVLGYELGQLGPKSKDISRIEAPMTEVGRQGAALLHRIVAEPGQPPREVKIAATLAEGRSVVPPQTPRTNPA